MKAVRILKYIFLALSLGMVATLLIVRQTDAAVQSGSGLGSITPLMFDVLKFPLLISVLAWLGLQIAHFVLKARQKKAAGSGRK